PGVLDDLVLGCLEKSVEARVPSMRALSDALAAFEGVEVEPEVVRPPARSADRDERTRAPARLARRSEPEPSQPGTRELVSMPSPGTPGPSSGAEPPPAPSAELTRSAVPGGEPESAAPASTPSLPPSPVPPSSAAPARSG